MSQHARLQPSSAGRWIACPGSVAFSATFPDRPTRAAAGGTVCHALLHEMLVDPAFEPQVGETLEADGFKIEVSEDMDGWVREVAAWVREYLADHPGSFLLSEERVAPGRMFGCPDDFYGTADVLVSSPDCLLVLDAKFGHHAVKVEKNPQLISYALGAMSEFGWVHPKVTLAIHQPRAGGAKVWEITAAELEDEFRTMAPQVVAALSAGAPLHASDDACRFCPAAGGCPEAQKYALAVAREDFPVMPIPTEDLLILLDNADRIRDALNAAERYAETMLATGQDLPGWTRVYARKRRAWTDEKQAEAAIRKLGYDPFKPQAVITPPQAEKLVGKATAKLLAPLIDTPRGEPVLARAGDERDPVAPEFPIE